MHETTLISSKNRRFFAEIHPKIVAASVRGAPGSTRKNSETNGQADGRTHGGPAGQVAPGKRTFADKTAFSG